jgi:hypothetical protein
VRNWAGYLQQETIAAGLNKYCSRIDPELFDRIRKNSNAVEAAHHRANSTGKRCSLLQAVLKYVASSSQTFRKQTKQFNSSERLDREEIQQLTAKSTQLVDLTWRNKAFSDRYETAMTRKCEKTATKIL